MCNCEAGVCSCGCLKPLFAVVLAVLPGLKSPFVLAVAVVAASNHHFAVVLAVVPGLKSPIALAVAVVNDLSAAVVFAVVPS